MIYDMDLIALMTQIILRTLSHCNEKDFPSP